jgi:hypothetical protein
MRRPSNEEYKRLAASKVDDNACAQANAFFAVVVVLLIGREMIVSLKKQQGNA